MEQDAGPEVGWRLILTKRSPGLELGDYSLKTLVPDREARWAQRSLPSVFPILMAEDGRLDLLLNRFFAAPQFLDLAADTQRTYAREICTWANYLDQEGLTWLDATEDDYLSFKIARTSPAALPRPVAGSTWDKAEAALSKLYGWACAPTRRLTELNPVPADGTRAKRSRSKNSKSFRPDRWVTPATFRLWRSLGVHGYSAVRRGASHFEANELRTDFRARNSLQHNAYANLTFATGLRLREVGSLLAVEVPVREGEVWLASAVGKGSVGRSFFWPSGAVRDVQQYVSLTRRAAIARARKAGRYDGVADILWVAEVRESPRGREIVFADTGEVRGLDSINAEMRTRLYIDGESGPEPMHLWLNERGLPMIHERWETVFDRLNDRADRALREAGYEHERLRIKPHSLRFSFALSLLVSLHRRRDLRIGVDPNSPYDEERYLSDYEEVQGRLGHADVQTTIKTYLRPMKRLRGDGVFFTSDSLTESASVDFYAEFAKEVVYGGGDAEVRDLVRPDSESGVIPRV